MKTIEPLFVGIFREDPGHICRVMKDILVTFVVCHCSTGEIGVLFHAGALLKVDPVMVRDPGPGYQHLLKERAALLIYLVDDGPLRLPEYKDEEEGNGHGYDAADGQQELPPQATFEWQGIPFFSFPVIDVSI